MKKFFSLIKSKKGMALATVIGIFATVAVLGTATATVAVSQARSAKKAEEVTAARYLARAAVDIVSKQLEDKLNKVDAARSALLNALPAEKTAALEAYEAAKAALAATRLIPASYSSPEAVIVDGILENEPVTVYVNRVAKGGKDYLEVSCTLSYNGGRGSASARVSSIAQESASVTISSYVESEFFWQGDAIYSWGNVRFDKAPDVKGDGAITAAGTVTGYPKGISGVGRDMPILIPPAGVLDIDKTSSTKKAQMVSGGKIDITPADNGYYGALSCDKFEWSVDTSAGDVILIFDSIEGKNKCEINIRNGQNKLYIYVIESSTYTADKHPRKSTLISFKNRFDIIGLDDSDRPLTYIIAFNDSVQRYYQTHDSNLIPEDQIPTSPIDEVDIKNGPRLDAYFYLPCTDISFKNNSTITGAVYASSMYAKNNTTITFQPLPENDLFEGYLVVSTQPEDQTVSYTALIFDKKRVWLD